MNYPKIIENLIEQLMKLPGVGRRSAERMVFWLLNNPVEESARLSQCVTELRDKLLF